jgi:mycobactin lysine-N-oxygenase
LNRGSPTAQAYWSHHRANVHASIAAGQRVAVIGAGGAAAAICVDALATITDAMPEPGGIVLIAPQATLFTRGESRFETEVLTQADTWTALPREARRQVAEHLLSGVVFRRVLDRLEGLGYLPAFFVGRAIAAVGHAGHVGLWCVTLDDRTTFIEADWVVDASGFDPLWFADLLEEPARAVVRRLSIPTLAEHIDDHLRLVIEAGMLDDESLRLPLIGREPGLHVPFLAGGSRPPGRASLLQLGILAEEILQNPRSPSAQLARSLNHCRVLRNAGAQSSRSGRRRRCARTARPRRLVRRRTPRPPRRGSHASRSPSRSA